MTSTEFAARYRLLKNVAMRGARSFLAQQVALGRMVMVHYLDSETPEQRSATLAALNALRSPGRDKLVEILDVDGSPVAVTLFLASFVDFTTWLEQVSDPAVRNASPATTPASGPTPPTPRTAPPPVRTPGEFTQLFSKLESTPEPPSSFVSGRPISNESVPQRTPGEFTQLFGAVSAPETPPPRSEPPRIDESDVPTLIMDSPPSGRTAKKDVIPTPPAGPPPKGAESFTAIFGAIAPRLPAHGSGPATSPQPGAADWPLPPAAPATSGADMMTPPPSALPRPIAAPAAPVFGAPPPAPPPGSSAASDKPGELTRMFRQMLAGMPAVTPPGNAPPLAQRADLPAFNAEDRPAAAFGRADAPLPPSGTVPSPSFGAAVPPGPSSLGSLLSATPPAIMRPAPPSNAPSAETGAPNEVGAAEPPAPAWGVSQSPPAPNMGGLFGGSVAGQSEYTQVLRGVPLPPPPPVVIQAPGPEAAAVGGNKSAKSLLPLIIALGAIVALTIAIVAYFVFAK